METATCKHCRKPIVRCDSVPSHAGCASGYGWIHSNPEQWGHSCQPRSGAPYAQPDMPTVSERVAAGAAFLDEHDHEWWRADVDRAIDLDRLDMSEGDSCVLGQRCPLSVLAEFVGLGPESVDDDERDLSFAAMAARFGAPVRSSGYFTDEWGDELGFQAHLKPSGLRDPDDYAALTAEWRKVLTERREEARNA